MITSSNKTSEFILNIYIGMFLLFMFIPLLLMMAAGFNVTDPPSITDWQGVTLKWFYKLKTEDRLIRCLGNSFKIVGVVVPLSVMLGLSAALILTRIRAKVTNYLYAVLVSPMLTPGIILGITTIVFWQKIGVNANLFTVMLAQTSFICHIPYANYYVSTTTAGPISGRSSYGFGCFTSFVVLAYYHSFFEACNFY